MPLNQPANREVESLLPAVIAGDADAIAAWYAQEHPRVYRLAVGFLADSVEAEDLAQDAMLHLMDRLNRCASADSYRGWCNTVVANLCRDRRRGAARRAHHEGAVREGDFVEPAADAAAERGETRDLITRALQGLTEREREVFVLRDLEQNGVAETAAALGITQGTVRSLLSLARRRLRQLLGPELVERTA